MSDVSCAWAARVSRPAEISSTRQLELWFAAFVPFDFQASYDQLNPADDDYRFYARLAADLSARDVIDLGCGTGTLARLLAARGCRVVAIDPAPDMLSVAASKGPTDQVEWRLGFSDAVDTESADLLTMSGHVAQVFIGDEEWQQVVQHCWRALRYQGVFAFESRNPDAREWETWTREQTLRVVHTPVGRVEFWHETVEVRLPVVVYDTWTANLATGERHCSMNTLAFRSLDLITASLEASGFRVTNVYSSWTSSPVTDGGPELITLAKRSEAVGVAQFPSYD